MNKPPPRAQHGALWGLVRSVSRWVPPVLTLPADGVSGPEVSQACTLQRDPDVGSLGRGVPAPCEAVLPLRPPIAPELEVEDRLPHLLVPQASGCRKGALHARVTSLASDGLGGPGGCDRVSSGWRGSLSVPNCVLLSDT